MSKKLILCVVLALSLILVGTGYAYWTDTLNVTTKATTGDFDVTFVDLGAYAQYYNEGAVNHWSIIDGINKTGENQYDGYVGAHFFGAQNTDYNGVFEGKVDDYYARADEYNSVTMAAKIDDPGVAMNEDHPALPYGDGHIVGDTISIELNNLYPGYAQAFRSDIINIGSIAAKLSTVDFKLSKLGDMDITKATKDLIGVALLVQDETYKNDPVVGAMVKLAANFDDDDIFELGGVEFVRLSALVGSQVEITENSLLLVPDANTDQRADLFIGIAVDPDAVGKYTSGSTGNDDYKANTDVDAKTQNKGVQLDITFGWDQFNEGNNPKTTNILEKQNKPQN